MNPFTNPDGSDSVLGQLEKIRTTGGGLNPSQQDQYNTLKAQADANDPVKQAQAKIDAQTAQNKADTDARFAQNASDLTAFNTKFGTAVPQIINDTSTKYGLGTLLGQANALNSRVSTLQNNSDNSGAGGYASGAQVDAAVNSRYLPRAQQAVTNLNTATGLAQNEEQTQITPYTTEANLLNDRLAREATSYTAEQQSTLDALIAQMNAGVSLTSAQIQQATSLAVAEKNYQATLATNQANKDIANTRATQTAKAVGSGGIFTGQYDANGNPIIVGGIKPSGGTSSSNVGAYS